MMRSTTVECDPSSSNTSSVSVPLPPTHPHDAATATTSKMADDGVRQSPRNNNNNNDVYKLFMSFAITFAAVHQLVHTVITQSSYSTITADAKTCVETEANIFHCTDDPSRSKNKRSGDRNTIQHYLQNAGVPQAITGSDEEIRKMREVERSMENYLRSWILTTTTTTASAGRRHESRLAEIWYVSVCGSTPNIGNSRRMRYIVMIFTIQRSTHNHLLKYI